MRLLFAAILISTTVPPTYAENVDFASQIAPIFAAKCVGCHSPGIRKGEFSLATIEDAETEGYLVAGEPDQSHLVDVITGTEDSPPRMPKEGEPLTADEVELVRRWIEQGAAWPEEVVIREKSKADATWWSFQPLAERDESTIDELIDKQLNERGLKRNPPADRRTLIRRATYDLTGLPPTPDEVEQFINDSDPAAYEKLIDRLLASPRYGERWGRHWLDVVRFGESNGFERNVIINTLWPFRDYVIQSINDDKPFDQFIRQHIAGDVIGEGNPDMAVATAFLVAGPYDDVGNQDPAQAAQIRANTLDEMIRATGQAFLGITIGCARCHDHKFDPITQEDYYGMYATFAGVRHGAVPLAAKEALAENNTKRKPLTDKKRSLEQQTREMEAAILERAKQKLAEYESRWPRPPVDRTGTEERFEPVTAKFVRLVCEAQDVNPNAKTGFGIDEFEVWSTEEDSRNVALTTNGGTATGQARRIEDFEGAYGPQLAIDGKTGARFLSTGTDLTIELAEATEIDRVVFSSAKGESTPAQRKFVFVAEYRIDVSSDGKTWQQVASGEDRKPVNEQVRNQRLLALETSREDREKRVAISRELNEVNRELAKLPTIPSVWIGSRTQAKGPFHVFIGGSPQKKGNEIVPASLDVLRDKNDPSYELTPETNEAQRRLALANWIVHPNNPLTPRVLANRLWHYHFGTGIVDTPSDFGYMGGRPTHPELLDFLAQKLIEQNWQLKPMHKLIMLSETYRQASTFRDEAAKIDGDARYLWRFPPRRLSAEEIRDTILMVSGKLDLRMGGPGFRLYHFMQDNVCTYDPLPMHGPETYRRAVYHQNARASVVDLMSEFDQPDCAFSTPKRAETTTPLQALTLLNHSFTIDMSNALAHRLKQEAGQSVADQIVRAYQLCYARQPVASEVSLCQEMIDTHGLPAFCRVLLNTSEMIYVQ